MKIRNRESICKNCKSPLHHTDNYCKNCGQENHYHNHSIKELWSDFVGSFFNFDGKIWRTLNVLLFKPGKISKDFVEGEKKKYVPPMRMYIFVSFLYFVVINLGFNQVMDSKAIQHLYEFPDVKSIAFYDYELGPGEYKNLDNFTQEEIFEYVKKDIRSKKKIEKQYKRTLAHLRLWEKVNAVDSFEISSAKQNLSINVAFFNEKKKKASDSGYSIRFYLKPKYDSISVGGRMLSFFHFKKIYDSLELAEEFSKQLYPKGIFRQKMAQSELEYAATIVYGSPYEIRYFINNRINKLIDYYSYSIFLMMPFAALFLYVFFFKRHSQFYPHLLFTVHLHTALFVYLIACLSGIIFLFNLLPEIANDAIGYLLLGITIPIFLYMLFAARKFYENKWIWTILKSLLAFLSYYFIVSLVFSFLKGLIYR